MQRCVRILDNFVVSIVKKGALYWFIFQNRLVFSFSTKIYEFNLQVTSIISCKRQVSKLCFPCRTTLRDLTNSSLLNDERTQSLVKFNLSTLDQRPITNLSIITFGNNVLLKVVIFYLRHLDKMNYVKKSVPLTNKLTNGTEIEGSRKDRLGCYLTIFQILCWFYLLASMSLYLSFSVTKGNDTIPSFSPMAYFDQNFTSTR